MINYVSFTLFANCTLKHTSAHVMPFSLFYVVDVVVFIEVMVHLARIVLTSKVSDPHHQIDDVKALEERIRNTAINSYQK